jgi:hypothetical protein
MTYGERFDRMDERFDRIDLSVERLMNYMLEFRAEVSGRLQSLETQTHLLASSQQSFEAKLPALTRASLEGAEAISSLYRLQMESGGAAFEVAERVRKLEETVVKLQAAA